MLKIERVGAGEDALRALVSAISLAKGLDPLAPVTVVTPIARAAVRLLPQIVQRDGSAGVSGMANVTFVVLERLARELGREASVLKGRVPLTRSALLAACRGALAQHAGPFGAVADHPSTVAEIVERYEELRVIPGAIDVLSRRGGVPAALTAIVREIRGRVSGHFYDDVDLFGAAAEQVRVGRARELGDVVVYGPERLRSAEAALLRALAERTEVRVLLVETGNPPADQVLESMAALLDASPAAEPAAAAEEAELAGMTAPRGRFDVLLRAPDPQSEVREGTRRVLEYLESGGKPESVAIVYVKPEPYAVLLRGELDDAQIPWSGPSPERLSSAPSAQFLRALVELRPERVARRTLIALLNAAPLHAPSSGAPRRAGLSVGPVGDWDRCSRLVGMTEGSIAEWVRRLRELGRESARPSATAFDPAAPQSPRPRRARRTATSCAELAGLLEQLGTALDAARTTKGLAALAKWASGCLVEFLGPDELRAAWPAGAGDADERIVALLEELAALDALEPAVDLDRFAEILAAELDRPRPRLGHLGSGVIVGPLDQVLGLQLALVVVLGCSDGDLPRRAPTSPLLSAADREAAQLEDHRMLAEEVRDLRRVELAIAAATVAIATAPRLDPRAGRVQLPSRFVLDAAATYEAPGADAAYAEVAAGSSPLNADELACALLLEAGRIGLDARSHFLAQREPELQRGLVAVLARRYEPLGPYDGGVGPHELASRTGRAVSPTTLEDFASCPFRYLLAHALGCEAIDEPEHRFAIDPRDRGSIVHEVLERYVGELVAAAAVAGERDGEGPALPGSALSGLAETGATETGQGAAARAARLVELAEEVFGRYERLGRTGKRVLWNLERRRLLRMLERERIEDEHRVGASGRRPLVVEHVFGIGDAPPVTVEIGSRPVAFRGRIDRIDSVPGSGLAVIDYKTGRADEFRRLRDDPVDRGRHLQLPIYAFAARAAFPAAAAEGITAAFRFVGQGSEEVEFVLDAAGTERFEEALRTILDQIGAGLFPYHPGANGENCRFCDFDGLCPSGRASNWERARRAPGLAGYVALAEPEPEPAEA